MSWILLATDGSEHATMAARLVASIKWPADTRFGVIAVVPTLRELAGLPWTPVAPSNMDEVEASELARAKEATWTAVDAMRAAGLKAHCRVLRGSPADVIVTLAERYHAELVVLGSRGLGTFKSALLGSVSADVIDRAPCPALVARSDRLARSVIADDGSSEAEAARAFVMARPHLVGQETRLVGVRPLQTVWPDSMVPADSRTIDLMVESYAAVRRGLAERLDADAAELGVAGVAATTEVRDGHAAHELVAAAKTYQADLIVVGTHGRRGITRLAMGSVSRALVHEAACSVLVVHLPHAAAVDAEADRLAQTGVPHDPPVFPMPLP